LKQIANMKLTRKEFLMKLGARVPRLRAAWRLIDIDIAPSGTAFSFTLNREKLRQVRRREGRYCCAPISEIAIPPISGSSTFN